MLLPMTTVIFVDDDVDDSLVLPHNIITLQIGPDVGPPHTRRNDLSLICKYRRTWMAQLKDFSTDRLSIQPRLCLPSDQAE